MGTMFISDLGGELCRTELNVYSNRMASYLQSKGVEKGDRVAVMMPNILQYPIVVEAVLKAGAVLVNVNPLYTADELGHIVADSGAKVLVVFNGASSSVNVAVNEDVTIVATGVGDMLSGAKRHVVNLATTLLKGFKYPIVEHDKFLDIIQKDWGKFEPVETKPEDMALIQYTGATTGKAKGVELTYANIEANAEQVLDRMDDMLGKGDIVIAPLPLYHVYAFIVHMIYLPSVNGTSLLVANPRDINKFIKTLRNNRFTGFVGLNTLFNALMNHKNFDKVDFSESKITISGGMTLTPDVYDRWLDTTGTMIAEGYGLTETSPVLCLSDPRAPVVGSVGKFVNGVRYKIADDGELLVKGPNVFKRYHNNKEATKEAFTTLGWFRTGDIVELDSEGNVFITDRKKNMIIVSGFNVYPTEVENALSKHPAVAEAGVIGVGDNGNEKVVAFVVKKGNVTAEELRDFCRIDMTSYKVPRKIVFVDQLPKSPVGKVLHKELRNDPKYIKQTS